MRKNEALERSEEMLELGVEPRDLAQERGPVIAQRVLDLVAHRQLAVAQQARLPELGDAGAQQRFVALALAAVLERVALGQEFGDGEFGVEQALALHLGRVRGEHGRHPGTCEARGDVVELDARVRRSARRSWRGFRPDGVEASRGSLSCSGPASDPMAVLGDIGQMREIREGADHRDSLRRGQPAQQQFERMAGRGVLALR